LPPELAQYLEGGNTTLERQAKVPVARSSRKRGARAWKTPAILEAMRRTDPEKLLDMKEEEMAANYGAARSTCREARNQVLGERDTANSRQSSPVAK
jgi:hypothetical protein